MSVRRPGVWGVVLLALGLVSVGPGCGCGATPPATPLVAPGPVASASVAALPEMPPSPAATLDLSVAEPLLSDPRLADVVRALEMADADGAARAMERALAGSPVSDVDRPRWLYQLGKLHTSAHHGAEARAALSEASRASWPLAAYAACATAQEDVRAGHHDAAIAIVAGVPTDLPISAACRLTAAEAHEAKGQLVEALVIWRAYLDGDRKPPRWAEVSLKAAKALLPTEPVAALRLARRVAIEQPAGPLGARALELEQAAAASAPKDDPARSRTTAEELTRASALLDAGRTGDAEQAVRAIEAALPADARRAEEGCKAATLSARIRAKRKDKAGAADGYGVAIERCSGDALASALYQGGVASDKAGRPPESLVRYERLEREAKGSRYADDARVKGALAALALGDEARFSSMLERIADDYPDGDMVGDGLFRLALHRIAKGDWAGSTAPLESAIRARPHEKEYWAAGRAPYFHARALLATGERERAKEELRKVIADHPLSYYMALAHARLAELDPADAAQALESAAHREADGPLTVPDDARFHTPGFARAVELLKQGDTDLARGELSALGLTGAGATPDTEWTVAELYGRSGAFALAHSLPRGKLVDWLDHYPVARWRAAWEVAYPRPFPAIVAKEAKASGIPTSLAYAIMREESAFDANVISGAQAHGLMQLILPTGKLVGKRLGLTVSDATIRTPPVNIALGCRFLADLRSSFPDCPALAIPAYNAGPGAPRRWLSDRPYEDLDVFVERMPYEETRNYTKRVLKSYLAYLYLYEPSQLGEVLRLPLRPRALPSTTVGPAVAGPEAIVEDEP